MPAGELGPAVTLSRLNPADLEQQSREVRDFRLRMSAKLRETLEVLGRNYGLLQKAEELGLSFNEVALLARQALTVLANVVAMAAPAESLIGAHPPAKPAIMAHTSAELLAAPRRSQSCAGAPNRIVQASGKAAGAAWAGTGPNLAISRSPALSH